MNGNESKLTLLPYFRDKKYIYIVQPAVVPEVTIVIALTPGTCRVIKGITKICIVQFRSAARSRFQASGTINIFRGGFLTRRHHGDLTLGVLFNKRR